MSRTSTDLSRSFTDLTTLKKLVSVGQSLVVVRDLHSLLKKIAEVAGLVLGADVVILYEYRADTHDVVVPPVIWGKLRFPEVVRVRGSKNIHRDSAVFRMLDRAQPVFAKEAAVDWDPLLKRVPSQGAGNFAQREGIASSAAVRLSTDRQRVGVLFVNYRHHRDFLPEEQKAIELFAAQTAAAIQNARLLDKERRLRHQANALREVSLLISSTGDLRETADQILITLSRVVTYHKATLQLIQADQRSLLAYKGFPQNMINEWLLRPISQDPLLARAIAGQGPLILSQAQKDEDWDILPQTATVKSWIGLPLIHREKVIGVITLDHRRAGAYTRELESLLIPFARQAAIALENALLFDDAHHRIRDLQIVNDVAQIIATNLDTPDLMRVVAERVAAELHCSHCTIFLPMEEDGQLMLKPEAIGGARHRQQIASRHFRRGEGLAGWAFEQGRAVMLADARTDARFSPARERVDQPRSMLIAPIQVGDQVLGVITADQDASGWFNASDLSLVKALARHVGIAIQRNRGLQLVQNVGQQINSASDVGEILRFIVSCAIELTQTTSGVIYLIDQQRQIITHCYKYPDDSFHPAPRMQKEDSLTRQIMMDGRTRVFPNLQLDEQANPELRAHYNSMIAVPLKHDNAVMGVLYLNHKLVHDFTQAEQSLLATLSNQAATAIVKTQLLMDLELQVNRHRLLNQVGTQLAGILDEQEILNEVAQAAADTLDCTHCSVFRIEAGRLVVKAVQGNLAGDLPLGRSFAIGVGVAGWVAQQGQAALVPYTHADRRFDPTWSNPPPESLVNVPIFIDQQVYGVISVEHSRPFAFNERDQRLLETLALQVSQALRSARRIHELEVLYETGQEFNQQLDSERLYATLLDRVNRTLEGQYSTLFLADVGGQLRGHLRRGPEAREDQSELIFPPGQGLAGWVAQERQSLIIPNVDAEPRMVPLSRTIPPGQPHSMLLAPLMSPDRLIGVIAVDKKILNGFDKSAQRLLDTMCIQAAVAIENARLFQQSQQQSNELALLHEISVGWMTRDLDTLLLDIVQGALRVTSTEYGALYLLSEGGARIVDSVNYPTEFSLSRQDLSAGGLTRQIYEQGVAIFIPDTTQDKRVSSVVEQYNIRSFIGQPLKTEQRVVGVLYLNDTKLRQFSEAEQKLIATLASQATIAIENARLKAQRQRDMAAIRQVMQIVGTIGVDTDPLPVILAETVKLFKADYGSFALLDAGGDRLTVKVIYANEQIVREPEISASNRLLYLDGIMGKVAQEGQAYFTGDAAHDSYFMRRRDATVSILVVPLPASRAGERTDEVIGVLNLESSEQDAFGQTEKTLCQDLANIAAMAIEKGRLFAAMQELNRQIEGLHGVVEDTGTAPLLERILEGINALLGKEETSSSMCLYDRDQLRFYNYQAAGLLKDYLLHMPPRNVGTSSFVLEQGKPLYLDDVRQPPPGLPTIRPESIARGVRSFAALPLRRQDQIFGMLFVNLQKPLHFGADVKRILELFASQAAVAIENAHLYEDLQRRVRYLDALNRVVRRAQDPNLLDPHQLFRMVVHEAMTMLEAVRCTLFVSNDEGQLIPQAWESVNAEAAKRTYQPGEGLASWVAQEGRSERVNDVAQDERFVRDAGAAAEVSRSMVLAPLWVEGLVRGVISADREGNAVFDEIDQRFVETLAVQAGILWRQQEQRRQRMEGFRRQRNPYVVGEPIRNPEGFFGRRGLIHRIMNGIHQNSFILFGERRIGKTSILYQLENRLRAVAQQQDPYYFAPALASLQGVAEAEFFGWLFNLIRRAVGIPLVNDLTARYTQLEDLLEAVVPNLQAQQPQRRVRIVLLLDEMDQFAGYSSTTHEQLRSQMQTRIGEYLKLVMAGVTVQRMAQLPTSPWYNLFEPIEIPEISKAAARRLLVEPVRGYYRYRPEALRLLLEYGDFKPCDLQRLGARTVEVMLARVSASGQTLSESITTEMDIEPADALAAAKQVLHDKEVEYQEAWSRFNPLQQQALQEAVQHRGIVDLTLTDPEGLSLFTSASLYNVVRRDDDQIRLTYLFSEWLKGLA